MATSDSPLSVPDVTLAVARGAGGSEPTGAPSISSVTDNGDGTLTIQGSNFGSKDQVPPIKFERFEGVDGQLVDDYNPEWVAYSGGENGAILSNAHSHSGIVSASNTRPSRHGFDTNYFIYPETDVVRVSYWTYYDVVPGDDYQFGGSTTQIKNTRITSTQEAGGGGAYNGVGDFTFGAYFLTENSGSITRNNGVEVLASSLSPIANRYLTLEHNTWNRVDMMIRLSTPGVADGEMRVLSCSPAIQNNRVWKNIVTLGEGQSFKQNCTILGLMMANYASEFGNPISVFIDDVYIDTTWAAVEIGDSSDYPSCTRRDYCKPIAWDGSTVTVELNTDPIPSGTNYVFITNELGEISPGYEVTL